MPSSNPRYQNWKMRERVRRRTKDMGKPCGICGKPIDYSLGFMIDPRTGKKRMHPMAFVVDEMLPVSKGGSPIDIDNCQPAHWICNARKGNKTDRRMAVLHLVTGAPCSGKSTYVQQHKSAGDVVLDLDAIAYALGADAPHNAHGAPRTLAVAVKEFAIVAARRRGFVVWVIETDPPPHAMNWYRAQNAIVHHLDPGRAECIERAKADKRCRNTFADIGRYYKDRGGNQEGEPAEPVTAEQGANRALPCELPFADW